jgi:hypothetical protein
MSFLAALGKVQGSGITFIVDGDLPNDFSQLLPRSAEVHTLGHIGNAASFRYALELSLESAAARYLYFAEDDYLYVPDAIAKLIECLEGSDVDYVTLYDHPARYGNRCDDLLVPRSAVFHTASHHWRRVESTCMSFGVASATIRNDVHRLVPYVTRGEYPSDREMWRALQCLIPSARSQQEVDRILVSPIPSLATHCDLRETLAPVVDWESVARRVPQVS